MSKICFLTDRLPSDPDPFSALIWNQFRTLADSQHDVLIVTSAGAPEGERWQHPRIQIIEPFSKFSIRFLPRLLQVLAIHKPDILHWIESRDPGVDHLQWLTPALSTIRKRPILAMSLWNVENWEKSWMLSGTLPSMDLLFVTHPIQREMLWHRWPYMMSRVMVAPLIFNDPPASSHWILNWSQEFDFVPGDVQNREDMDVIVEGLTRSLIPHPERNAVMAVSNRELRFLLLEKLRDRELDGRIAVLEDLDWSTWNELLLRARQIRTDLLNENSPHLAMAIEWSRAKGRSIQLSDAQQSLINELQFPDASNFLARAYQSAFKDKEARVP